MNGGYDTSMSALKGLTFVSSVHRRASKYLDLFQVLGLIIVDSKNASVSLKYTKENQGEGLFQCLVD